MAKHTNQYEKVYKALRQRLLARSIKSGQRLVEQACAEEFGVNRSDVRQALARLEVEGMVTRGAKGGVFARTYSEEDIREICFVRITLETAAVKLAVHNATEDELAQLDEIAAHMQLMADNAYEMGFAEADIRFHQCIVEASHNRALIQTYLLSNIPLSMTRDAPKLVLREKLLGNAKEHKQIVRSLREKNAKGAIELLELGLAEMLPNLENSGT